jgi:hypothetical protein
VVTLGRSFTTKQFLPLKGNIEYCNSEEIAFNDTLLMTTLRYRRIFNGGIVLGNISYVDVTFSPDGELIGIEAKWPTFEKVRDDSIVDVLQALDAAQTVFSKSSGGILDSIPVEPISVNIEGVANAWNFKKDKDGTTMLTPCLSVIGKVTFTNGKSVPKFIQIPRSFR